MGFSARMLVPGLLAGCALAPGGPGTPGEPARRVQAVAVAAADWPASAPPILEVRVLPGAVRDASGSVTAAVAER